MKKNKSNTVQPVSLLLESKQVKFWRALMACHDKLYKHFESNLAQKGLSYSRFQLLFHIYFNPNCSAIFLAEKMNVTRGNMSTFLKRMLIDDLINETFEKNKKRCGYELSNAGLKLFEKTLEIHLNEIIHTLPNIKENMVTDLEKLNTTLS